MLTKHKTASLSKIKPGKKKIAETTAKKNSLSRLPESPVKGKGNDRVKKNINKSGKISAVAEDNVFKSSFLKLGLGEKDFAIKAPIGQMLVGMKVINKQQLAEVLTQLPEQNLSLGEYLIQKKMATDNEIQFALAKITQIPFQEKLKIALPGELLTRLPIRFIKKNLLVPIKLNDRELDVAIYDPFLLQPLDDVRMIFPEFRIHTVISTKKEIEAVIAHYFEKTSVGAESMLVGLEEADMHLLSNKVEETRDLMEQDSDSPIIQLVDAMINGAVTERASDIHIEPFEKDLIIRYRIDGMLHEVLKPPQKIQSAIISRVKVMAKLNIAETRLPQDGRIQLRIGKRDLDIRISILPCYWGERVVMRLLNKTDVRFSLDSLGFEETVLAGFRKQMQKTTGVILVTGPTGSGKSTTLYGALSELNEPDRNIMTIEDPVEYQIAGINQMHVKPQIDLTFARGLRAMLRQDPDIIMVGEIRDTETARIAVQAALTGHLVFSTLHTNDAVGSVIRLIDMGVEPYLVNSSVTAFLSQRLVRVICSHCKTAYKPEPRELLKLGLSVSDLINGQLKFGKGCGKCKQTGFIGRMMINELLVMNYEIMDLLTKGVSYRLINDAAINGGMRPMKQDAAIKVVKGYTTIDEVLRVSV